MGDLDQAATGQKLAAGLYLVATPIGRARDITLTALDMLRDADVIAAEDTRTARRLMDIHAVPLNGRKLVAYHDHSGEAARARIASAIAGGKSVAYVSEAGSPLIADPGFALSRVVAESGGLVTAAPGACAVVAALSVAGLPTDRFFFAGFMPNKPKARLTAIRKLADIPGTLVFYESPKRAAALLAALLTELGDRDAAICRELTKKFEQVARGKISVLKDAIGQDVPNKGEFVIVVGPPTIKEVDEAALDAALNLALQTQTVRDAASDVANHFGVAKKRAYARALELKS